MIAWSIFPASGVRLTNEDLIKDLQRSLNIPNTQVQYEWCEETADKGAGWEKTELRDNIEKLDFFPDVLISNKFSGFTFPQDTQLSWIGDRVLEVQANGNIAFSKNAQLKHSGFRGGLILKAYNERNPSSFNTATVTFEAECPPLDFSESGGAVSIFYNPQPLNFNDHNANKYAHPTNFNGLIIKNSSVYFNAFMLIHNNSDRNLMQSQGTGHYGLLNSNVKAVRSDTGIMPTLFNLNRCSFNRGSYAWSNYPIAENYVFEENDKSTPYWGSRLLSTSPPLYGAERHLIRLLASKNDKEAVRFMELLDWLNPEWGVRALAYVGGEDLATPLHLAVKYGCCSAVQAIFQAAALPKALGEKFINCPNAQGLSALHLAATMRQLDGVRCLVNLYKKMNYFFDAGIIVQQVETKIIEPYTQIASFLRDQALPSYSISPYWKAFPNAHIANDYEYKSSQDAHRRFFVKDDLLQLSQRVQKLFEQFKKDYKEAKSSTLNINGLPSRSRILLMRLITQEKLKMMGCPPQKNPSYWTSDEKEDRYPTSYLFGESGEHKFFNQPTANKPGFVYYNAIGKYDSGAVHSIRAYLTEISTHVSPQAIARLTRLSRVSGNPITTDTLLEARYTGSTPKEDADYLNRFTLLWDLEVASRLACLPGKSPTPHDQLPIGAGITRIQQYITATNEPYNKYLENPLADSNDPESPTKPGPYHIFTGEAAHREEALKRINEELHPLSKERRKKTNSDWENSHPLWSVVSTPERIHQELLIEYGGGYESDGEPYSDI